MIRHALNCDCAPCLLARIRLMGGDLRLDGGRIVPTWASVPVPMRDRAKAIKDELVKLLEDEAAFSKLGTGLGEVFRILANSSRPEATAYANDLLDGTATLEAGLAVADLIRYGDEVLEGRGLVEAVEEFFPVSKFDSLGPARHGARV